MFRLAGLLIPSPSRYHSLATRTYSLSAFGSACLGWTTIAPYIPFAICARTGFVPQWYMKTPGSLALNRKVNDCPGMTSLNATLGAMRAAWKSIECGIKPPFVRVISNGLALPNVNDRPRRAVPIERPCVVADARRDLDRHVVQRHVHFDGVARRDRRHDLGVVVWRFREI